MKIDFNNAFYTQKVSAETSKHFGFVTDSRVGSSLWKYLRLPQGFCISPWIYSQQLASCLADLDINIVTLVDDALLYNDTFEGLMDHFQKFLARCDEMNLRISRKKCQISRNVEFLGYQINEHGCFPSEKRLQAVKNFASPSTVKQLRSFLGLANQFFSFVPELQEETKILRELLHKNVRFAWLDVHEKCFQNIKSLLCSDLVVGHFNHHIPSFVFTDASREAI